MRVWVPVVLVGLVLMTGCGGSSRLSASDYRAQLATISKQADKAQGEVERGLRSTSVPQLTRVFTRFAAVENRVGDEVAALKPPKDAESANAQLAQGEHDLATAVRALVGRISKMPDAKAALAFVQKNGPTRAGHEIDQALTQLKNLGYTKSG
jgi:hypothetical protein